MRKQLILSIMDTFLFKSNHFLILFRDDIKLFLWAIDGKVAGAIESDTKVRDGYNHIQIFIPIIFT